MPCDYPELIQTTFVDPELVQAAFEVTGKETFCLELIRNWDPNQTSLVFRDCF
jgi:hypothetical protein